MLLEDADALFTAIRAEDPDFDCILQSMRAKPTLASARNTLKFGNERTPLQELLFTGAPLPVIEAAYEVNPQAIRVTDYDTNLPLHIACASNFYTSDEVVRFLYERYPQAVREKNKRDFYPLHCACFPYHKPGGGFRQSRSVETILLLIEAFPEALKVSCQQGIPFQLVCESNASAQVVRALGDVYPIGLRTKKFRDYPIHMACESSESLEVIKYILDSEPAMIRMQGASDQLPLHFACSRSSKLEIVQYLLELDPESVKVTSFHGELPLHKLGNSWDPELAIVKLLVNAFPESVCALTTSKNAASGQTPLHVFCSKNPRKAEIIEFLFSRNVSTNELRTGHHSRLALHMACGSLECKGSALESIKLLVSAWPESARIRIKSGQLAIEMWPKNKSVEFYNFLTPHTFPEYTQQFGILPVHAWCRKGLPKYAVDSLLSRCSIPTKFCRQPPATRVLWTPQDGY